MAGRTPEGTVWGYFFYAREMAKFHFFIRELKMPLFAIEDMVQMSFSQSFVTILEVVVGEYEGLIGLSYVFDYLKFLDLQ